MKDHEKSGADGVAHPYGVEFFGPLALEPAYHAVVNGRRVPYLMLHPVANDPGGEWLLSLDNRFVLVATDLEMRKWVQFLANAMAISAGYVCFGSDKRINLHNGPTIISLSPDEYQRLRGEGDGHEAP